MSERDDRRGASPVESFGLIAHDVRAEIVRTLGDAREGRGPPAVLSFAQLRSRCAADVGSSKFNYHLQELLGSIIERRDGGYSLRHPGTLLYRTIRAREYGDHRPVGPEGIGVDCHHCGTAVEATYIGSKYTVECPGCDTIYDMTLVAPGAVKDDDSDPNTIERLDEWVRHARRGFARGVCPTCANGLTTQLIKPENTFFPRPDLRSGFVHRSCDHCTDMRYLTVGEILRLRPIIAEFFARRNRPVWTTPLWDLAFAATDLSTTVCARNPWTFKLVLTAGGDTIKVRLDDSLTVTNTDTE
ncbi:MAG: hypothetical protein J07HN6_01508 [Halonotius sp. J07HN6]|jgi:hypothetical protein|nr:MAG: hypothetical protein J07HN6_01508 [Halonotius sp. J07HN6]